MANYFDTGILLTAGFSLSSQAPLDGRSVVELLTDLDTHITENRAYEGMCVYVKENKKNYIYNGTTWEEFVGGGGSSEKQIKDWVSGSSYLEGDYIYHEGEIYRCLTSNSNVDFDEANWKKLTYGIDELSKEDVERLLGLTEEEIEAMTDLILDTEVRIDKTYSSSKIYTDIQQCLEESKTYTLEELEKVKIDDTLTTTDKTIVGAINEVKDSIITNYKDLTNKPSIAGVELDGNKSLSDLGITIYDDTEVKSDIASLKEYKQNKKDDTLTTTDKTITGAINEVNGDLLDTVGFSADYKNIILNRKNGLNPYTIPISAIINNASLAELKDVDSTDVGDGKTLVYDGATNKHKYVDSSITDEFVKMDSTTDAKYLSDLIDKSTVVNDNGVLKVKKLDGQEVTITEINYLKGLTMNVMDLVSAFSNGGVKVWETPVNTYSDLETLDRSTFIDGISYIVYVLIDETHSNAKTTYLCTKTSTTFFGNADSQRNFTTNPIDLANEVTGKLGTSNIDVDNLWTLLTINDTYKTLTTNNEIFGTHGAKAMYDELVTEIGAKANTSDIPTKVSELENDSNFVGLNDTQASATTTYSSNKIADLITEATMGKDLGNLLIVESSVDMSTLATKDNLGKSVLYIGNSTINYTKGEIYELYWDAININYISFAYSPTIKFNFTKIQEILGTKTSLTVTGEYGYQNQKVWHITTDIGMAGDSLVNYGIISKQNKFVFGDKFKYTYDNSKRNSYRWLPTGNVPTWNLTKAWYNIDKFIMYNGTDDIYKKGRVYRLTGDKVTISTNSTEISNLAIDKDKFLNNCSLRGDITFKWMNEGYFTLSTNGSGDAKTYTKKQFNSWGITYDGDITIGNNYIKIVTSKDTSINNWEWKDVTDYTTDFDALKTKVDGKVDKTDIVDNLTSTDTNKPLSANQGKVLKDEVDKKAEIDDTQSSITTVYSSDKVDEITSNIGDISITKTQVLDFNNLIPTEGAKEKTFVNIYSSDRLNAPSNEVSHWIVKALRVDNEIRQTAMATHSSAVYVRSTADGTKWTPWGKICTTSVADVPTTYINTFENETYIKPSEANVCSYYVTNGRCEVKLGVKCLSTTNNFVQIISGLPKSKSPIYSNVVDLVMSNSGASGVFQLNTNGTLRIVCRYGNSSVTGDRFFYTSFSYPVAE